TEMARKVIDVPYSLNESKPNWTASAATTAGSGDGVTEVKMGEFLCPVGLTLVVLPISTLAAYLVDNEVAPAALDDGTPIRVVHTDSAGTFVLDRINTVYARIKDFADQNKMKRFEAKFAVEEKEKLIIYVIPASGLSFNPAVGSSRFEVACRSISKLLSI
ncbi:unnamed protein product, partial [marine sediment metagenome]